jgi:hypothetical protein
MSVSNKNNKYGTSLLAPYLSEYQPLRVAFFPQNGQLCG